MDSFASQYKLLSEPLRTLHDSEKIADILEKHPATSERAARRAIMVLISDTLLGLSPRDEFELRAQSALNSDRFVKSLVELAATEIFKGHEHEIDTLHQAFTASQTREASEITAGAGNVAGTQNHTNTPASATNAPTLSTLEAPPPTPHIAPTRVMPQSAAQVPAPMNPQGTTELPNALLQNLKASLMHGGAVVEPEPLEGTGPKASYTTMLSTTPKPPND
jgi:hypothetical protein